jgi:hypothetical protein
LGRFESSAGVLQQRLCGDGLALLDALVLALKGRRRDEMLDQADEALLLLRIHLRLATDSGLLEEGQLLYALERADAVGRQLGGWIKALGPV